MFFFFYFPAKQLNVSSLPIILKKVKIKRCKPQPPVKRIADPLAPVVVGDGKKTTVVRPDPSKIVTPDKSKIAKDNIVKQLSNGHALVLLKRARVKGFCVSCIRSIQDPEYKKRLNKIITYCSTCPGGQWTCESCFDAQHCVQK